MTEPQQVKKNPGADVEEAERDVRPPEHRLGPSQVAVPGLALPREGVERPVRSDPEQGGTVAVLQNQASSRRTGEGDEEQGPQSGIITASRSGAVATTRQLVENAAPDLPPLVQDFLHTLPDGAREAVLSRSLDEVKAVLTGLRQMPVQYQRQLPALKLPQLGMLFTLLSRTQYIATPDVGRLGSGLPPGMLAIGWSGEQGASDSDAPGKGEPGKGDSGKGAPPPPGGSGSAGRVAEPCTYQGKVLVKDGKDEWTITPNVALVGAFRRDYTQSKTYLQEGEGRLLAEKLGVRVEIFTQPDEKLPSIHRTYQYGSGATAGILLFVGGNHYIVLHELAPDDKRAPEVTSLDGLRFREGQETVADGNCLIDGLLILAGEPHGDEELLEMRDYLQTMITDEQISVMLQQVIAAMLQGDFPHGLGKSTFKALQEDAELWPEFERVRAAKEEQKRVAKEQAAKEQAEKEQAEKGAADKAGKGADDKEGAKEGAKEPAKDGASAKDQPPGKDGAPGALVIKIGGSGAPVIDNAPEFAGMSPERARELLAVPLTAKGLAEEIKSTRDKYGSRTASTGAPHVFNKIFGAYADAMGSALDEVPEITPDYAREITGQMQALMEEFEHTHRSRLVAHDLPPTSGPDENSLAFGSESKGLSFLMGKVADGLRSVTAARKDDAKVRPTINRAIDQVRTQMLRLAAIGIDDAAVRHLTSPAKNKKGAAAATRDIEAARQFVGNYSRIAAEGMISNFFADLERSFRKRNGTELDAQPDQAVPSAKELGTAIKQLRGEAATALGELEERQAERVKASVSGTDPDKRAVEIVQGIIATWGPGENSKLAALSKTDDGRAALADRLATARRTLTRVMAHAKHGVRPGVLPVTASLPGAPKRPDGFTDADYPMPGSDERVRFASTNARNAAYPDYESARAAALEMLGLGPGTRPHARYSIGPGGVGGPGRFDSPEAPGLRNSDIRIAITRDQPEGGNVGEGFVWEYITENGPMVLAYHSYDCTASIKVGKEKITPAPHFHVATLPGNDIDKEYWGPERPEERTPQFATGISTSRDRSNNPIKVAVDAKTYVQHDTDHHLYHL